MALALFAGAACESRQETRLARRILESYRRSAGVKPLPGSAVVRLKLSRDAGGTAQGTAQVEWDGLSYRESRSSGGLTTVRGIQGGKAYFTDEDGVTRVVSEPVLSELLTRSYFWRRAYLFDDLEKAKLLLGPADGATAAVTLTPRGGNALRLTFSRDTRRLEAVRSPGFALEFSDPTHFRDESTPGRAFLGEIRWTGLPTATLEDATVGGWRARWSAPESDVALLRAGHGALFDARISGASARVVLDARADGPMRVTAALARRVGAALAPDVLGRRVARGAVLELPGVSFPDLAIEESESISSGADAAAGAVLFREAVVEVDPGAGRLRLHDPARWVIPPGLFRAVLDDDGNRPVAILMKGRESLRLLAAVPSEQPIVVAPQTARRVGLERPGALAGLRWGPVHLPPLPAAIQPEGLRPDWGEDGTLGFELLLRARSFMDMPHRWIYLAGQER